MANGHGQRVAVITGASAGIGAAVAAELAGQGCRLVINARRREKLEAIARGLEQKGASVACVAGDASQQDVIDQMFSTAEKAFGVGPDIVVVNAGRGLAGSLTSSDESQWLEVMQTNYIGAARLMRTAADRLLKLVETNPEGEAGKAGPWLRRPRDIIAIGSSVGRNISPFSSMYGSTKFAVHALAEALRREVGPKGVRVTTIEPAIVASEFQGVAGYDPATFGAFMERIGPVLQPEDIARTIGFVVSQPAHVHLNNIAIRPTRQDYP